MHLHWYLTDYLLYGEARVEDVPPLFPKGTICRQNVQLSSQWFDYCV
jgi:hypothetical protein